MKKLIVYGVPALAFGLIPEEWTDTVDDFLLSLEADRHNMGIIVASTARYAVELVGKARAEKLHNLIFVLLRGDILDARDIVRVLGAGADRVEAYPIPHHLLEQQVLSMYRLDGRAAGPGNLDVGPMAYNPLNGMLAGPKGTVHLTKAQSRMLEIIVGGQGTIVTFRRMMDKFYTYNDRPKDKILSVHICNLRKRLRGCADGEFIDTIWGVGYRFDKQGLGFRAVINPLAATAE